MLYLLIFIKVPFYTVTIQPPLSPFTPYPSASCPLADKTRATAELVIGIEDCFGRDLLHSLYLSLTSDVCAPFIADSSAASRSRSWNHSNDSRDHHRGGGSCNRTALIVTRRSSISFVEIPGSGLLLLALILARHHILEGVRNIRGVF